MERKITWDGVCEEGFSLSKSTTLDREGHNLPKNDVQGFASAPKIGINFF